VASSTVEQYIKIIYDLALKSPGLVKLGELAEAMGVTQGTVTTMMKQIGEQGLVRETFLVQTLHYDWADVHEEAEALEHAVSPVFIQRLDELLGFPAYDPHGEPIPTAFGTWQKRNMLPLEQCPEGAVFRIAQIEGEGHEWLGFLKEQELTPGEVWILEECQFGAGVFRLRSDKSLQTPVLSLSAAGKIMVEILQK